MPEGNLADVNEKAGQEMLTPLAASSSSYPLLNIFWTILEVFLWVIWFWILIMVFIDIFRSPDLSGWAKALWFLFVLFIPLIGVLAYLIVRGDLDARAGGAAGRSLRPGGPRPGSGLRREQPRGTADEAR